MKSKKYPKDKKILNSRNESHAAWQRQKTLKNILPQKLNPPNCFGLSEQKGRNYLIIPAISPQVDVASFVFRPKPRSQVK